MTTFTSPIFLCAFLIIFLTFQTPSLANDTIYDVLKFGAKPNGTIESTQAFLDAWAAACSDNSSAAAIVYVPKGRYLVLPMEFDGKKCSNFDIKIRIEGTLVAQMDYRVIGNANNWLSFDNVNGVSIFGGGALDAKGLSLWACKAAAGNNNCPEGATTLSFTDSNNIRIEGLLSLNSQLYHIVINRCQNVLVQGVKIIAPNESPNTDGIHIQLSTNVTIMNSSIKTGDDCISIGPGTKNLWIERLACGPGHGISIGSLAKDLEEEGVQNVTVKQVVFTGSTNGFRIKSWARPSNGFVQGVRFLTAVMRNVQNPIVIDQNYCPRNENCPGQVSGVKISDVIYRDIQGTSATKTAINIDCSSKYPCTGIRLENVNLTYINQPAAQSQSSCSNAIGHVYGLVQPDGCL